MAFNGDVYEASLNGHFVIAGPCVLESLDLALTVAATVAECAEKHGLFAVFKSSYDKANRTSLTSYRGPGVDKGLEWLSRVKQETGLPVITDIHNVEQAVAVSEVADVLQIPAFLSRQTDLLQAAGRTGRVVNIKKGQFLAPWDIKGALDKIAFSGNRKVWLTERGASFGYNNLVVDFRSILIMKEFGAPIVFDATHSVQLPGGKGSSSGGQREFVPALSRAAAAVGANGVFMEVHPDPDRALCDGPNSLPLAGLDGVMGDLAAIWRMDFHD